MSVSELAILRETLKADIIKHRKIKPIDSSTKGRSVKIANWNFKNYLEAANILESHGYTVKFISGDAVSLTMFIYK